MIVSHLALLRLTLMSDFHFGVNLIEQDVNGYYHHGPEVADSILALWNFQSLIFLVGDLT